jgi:hypothetical protein
MKTGKGTQNSQAAKLRSGLAKLLGKSAKVHVQGKEVKIGEVLDVLDGLLANASAAAEASVKYRRAIATNREYRAQNHALVSGVRAYLVATLSAEELEECGHAPKKMARALTAEERTVASAKLRATRKANGTRSKKQLREQKVKAEIAAAYAADPPDKPGEVGPPSATH